MSRRNKPMTMPEIREMEKVCRMAAETLQLAEKLIKVGVSTDELNNTLHDHALSLGCESAPLNYHGFPKSICTSVNDVVCHGVPDANEILKPGDIINVDVTLKRNGFHGDTSRTFFVGDVSENARKVTEAARAGMYAGIAKVRSGCFNTDIGAATEEEVKKHGYFVVKDIGGHGIGKAFHMDPFVPAFAKHRPKTKIYKNTCITVEPMVNETSHSYKTLTIPNSDITYYKTLDGSYSAQFEHTILVTATGHEILTEW